MLALLVAFGIGLCFGAATGIPVGVVNVAIVEAATRTGRRRATAIGLGGALADGVHAALAFAGVAELVTRYREVERGLSIASGAIVVAYAALVWRRRRPGADHGAHVGDGPPWRGVLVGLTLTLSNPLPLLAWVVVAGAILPAATLAVALTAAAGVAIGSAAWFTLLARLASRGALDGAAARWVPRVIAAMLLGFGAWTVVHAVML